MKEYSVTDLKCIQDNPQAYIEEFTKAYHRFTEIFNRTDSTWSYHKYNVFTIMGPNPFFYDLQREISTIVREKVGPNEKIWFTAWLNFHKHFEVLDWHNHSADFHGYVCIDPKKTKTLFRDWEREDFTGDEWEIENEIGKLYLGPAGVKHKVEVIEPYEGDRITIGMDFCIRPSVFESAEKIKTNYNNLPIF